MSIPELHESYCRLTKLPLRYIPMEHDRDWYEWVKRLQLQDPDQDLKEALELVVGRINFTVKDKHIRTNMLSFSYLIRRPDLFVEHLTAAKADARKPQQTERDRVLASTGRPKCPSCDRRAKQLVRTPAQIIAEHEKMAAMLKAWKEQNP